MGGSGSGRKSIRDEVKRARIIEKAWNLVEQILDGKVTPKTVDKYELAKQMAVRDITQRLEGEGFTSIQSIQIIRDMKEKGEFKAFGDTRERISDENPS